MKTILFKDIFQEIKNSRKRFISILIMAFLGVGFFAGIKATSPDMKNTINNYYNSHNLYDIKIISTLGLEDADIAALQSIDGIDTIYGSYSEDVEINISGKTIISKISSLNSDINIVDIIDGNTIENSDECIVEPNFLKTNNLSIGDYIDISAKDIDENLNTTHLKIVGTMSSPLYISRNRGTTSLGNGTIDYCMYISKDNIKSEIYTEIFARVKNPNNYKTCSDEYSKYIDTIKEKLESIKSEREQARYDNIVNSAKEELAKSEEEFNTQKEDGQNEINTAEKKLSNALKEINSGKATLKNQKSQTNAQLTEFENQITAAKQSLETNRAYLSEEQILKAEQQIATLEETYNTSKTTANTEFAAAENKINSAEKEYNDGLEKLNSSKEEFNTKIADAEAKITQAKEDIDNIKMPKWYILDRNSNEGFVSFKQDSDSIANVGKVFPIVFFVIAILISLTTMTRMVEENRMQIGTFKTLGYSNLQIASKYIIYAFLACLIGGAIGMCVGFVLLPKIIWMMYAMMYSIPNFSISFNWYYGLIGLIAINLCIVGATILSIIKEIRQMPSVLMRPKAPKIGKRVFLEKINFIWKRLNFIQKVTARNMFRYKKRLFLTIIGIFGCTSLIVTGFGIKDSIANLIPNQYGKIFNYDLAINIKDDLTETEFNEFSEYLENSSSVKNVVPCYVNSISIKGNRDNSEDIQIIVPDNNDEISQVISLININTKQKLNLTDDTIIITDKLAELIGIKEGDNVTLIDTDNNEFTVKVGGITEHYISHYAYISKPLYEKLFEPYKTNTLYINCNNLSEDELDSFSTTLTNSKYTSGMVKTSYVKGMMDDAMNSLNYVVIILIISSGLLAFVVLYNLANINISERIRELATIKVLGFYPKEIFDYVNRETMILTIISIILGFGGGYCLTYFLMGTCEINILRFAKTVAPLSYLYSGLITLIFTFIVNIFTYHSLKKINMIESLKSVE